MAKAAADVCGSLTKMKTRSVLQAALRIVGSRLFWPVVVFLFLVMLAFSMVFFFGVALGLRAKARAGVVLHVLVMLGVVVVLGMLVLLGAAAALLWVGCLLRTAMAAVLWIAGLVFLLVFHECCF